MSPLSSALTAREHEIMKLLGRGKTSKEIAIHLKISTARMVKEFMRRGHRT
jgi:DNA-binding CsgD family transcriptional regulator